LTNLKNGISITVDSRQDVDKEVKMKFVNLTPDVIRLETELGVLRIESSGISRTSIIVEDLDPIYDPLMGYIMRKRIKYGPVEGLPGPENGTIYIVSRLVKQAVPDRTDCLVPDLIRDEDGNVICCRALAD
jgi:hypothetical protein